MIARITDPKIWQHPVGAAWLAKVCRHFNIYAEAYIAGLCAQAHTQVLLGLETSPKALLIIQLPSPLMLLPTVQLGYNEGSRQLGLDMMAQAAAFARAAGYKKLLMANRSGRSDAAYTRGLRGVGQVTGRATVFEVTPDEVDT